MKTIDTATAEHFIWGSVCDGWHLLKQSDLSIVQERVPPGAGEVKHVHNRAQQFFFILSGSAVLELEDRTVHCVAGQGISIPPGIVHRFANPGDQEVVFLVVSSPSTIGDRMNVEPAA
ncbi:MAG: cupin domain-containing protein [Desulfobacteraceae bacterium]|nr:MAG: cupin domain-containing protein [Desulfobacteraceae bacterium]